MEISSCNTKCTNNGVRFIEIQKMFWRGLVHATCSVGPLPPSGWLTFLSIQWPPMQIGPTQPHLHLPGYQHHPSGVETRGRAWAWKVSKIVNSYSDSFLLILVQQHRCPPPLPVLHLCPIQPHTMSFHHLQAPPAHAPSSPQMQAGMLAFGP
jgi:hypothetical protein